MNKTVPYRKSSNAIILEPQGMLDVYAIDPLERTVTHLLEEGERRFLLSLGKIQFMDSMGISAILRILKKIHSHKGSLGIFNTAEHYISLLDNTGILLAIKVYPISMKEDEVLAYGDCSF